MSKPSNKLDTGTDKLSTSKPSLDQLLNRKDIWRGREQVSHHGDVVDTGYKNLNSRLAGEGWPEGCLIDVALASGACEWLLMLQAVKHCCEKNAYVALLNPPYTPYAVGLAKMGIPLAQVVVLRPKNKNDFIACFMELSRSEACRCILSWAPKQSLSYTELRKCHLTTLEQRGIYVLFYADKTHQVKARNDMPLRQSSPASLRLSLGLQGDQLQVQILKQKGRLISERIQLDIPEPLLPLLSNRRIRQASQGKQNHKPSSTTMFYMQ